jgi:hypothetical protein
MLFEGRALLHSHPRWRWFRNSTVWVHAVFQQNFILVGTAPMLFEGRALLHLPPRAARAVAAQLHNNTSTSTALPPAAPASSQ